MKQTKKDKIFCLFVDKFSFKNKTKKINFFARLVVIVVQELLKKQKKNIKNPMLFSPLPFSSFNSFIELLIVLSSIICASISPFKFLICSFKSFINCSFELILFQTDLYNSDSALIVIPGRWLQSPTRPKTIKYLVVF